MAKIYADAQGTIVRFLADADQEKAFGAPPAFASVLDFDESTNAQVVTAIQQDLYGFTLLAGVLSHRGVSVPIAAPSSTYTDRQQMQTIRDGLTQYMGVATPTLAQTASAVKLIIRLLALIMDYYLKRLGQT